MTVRLVIVAAALLGCAACTSDEPREASASPSATPTTSAAAEGSPDVGGGPFARAWLDVTDKTLGETADWTNKVEVADIDLDGDVDLLFANGGDYESPGTPTPSRVFLNDGSGHFDEATRKVLGRFKGLTRVVKVADLDEDGRPDLVLGTTYSTRSRLFLADGDGWREVTRTHLPAERLSIGDLETGDADGDGDLDLVLADWGKGSPMKNRGGRVRLWLNDGSGRFTDATGPRMPRTLVMFSWDLELVDVDNDWDLDLAVSCKTCPTSLLYRNDGRARFTDVSEKAMPAFTNNYDFAAIDLDGDGFLDLVTINDGDDRGVAGLAEHVFRNDGTGVYDDVTRDWWPAESNPGYDDNVVVGLDVESDGDADFLVGSLDGPDRLLVNDGTGHLALADQVFESAPSRGTLGMAAADLNDDGLLDVVESQGEAPGYESERVYFGTDVLAPDTAKPIVRAGRVGAQVLARVHDNRTPYAPEDWRSVTVRWTGGRRAMQWYGEHLFRAGVPREARQVEVCATDRAGNETCARAE
jgi:VCBS repeat protein